MKRRFVAIWFPQLGTDWKIRHQPALRDQPFVLTAPERGRVTIRAASPAAQEKGIRAGMALADGRAILPGLEAFDDPAELPENLLRAFAEWCLRFTPVVALDLPQGLILEASGCPHLWGGEAGYLQDIVIRLKGYGYSVQVGMADTIGTAWAVSRYGSGIELIASGQQIDALRPLPPAALRLDEALVARLHRLGLYQIGSFLSMPRSALRRRFGTAFLMRLDQALGQEPEGLVAIQPLIPYQERLHCLEPIRTAPGIRIAIEKLLEQLCKRLADEGKGLRSAVFKGFRVDGETRQISIGTSRATRSVEHIFGLFEIKIPLLEPDLGFEVFSLEAPLVEDISTEQEKLWNEGPQQDLREVTELLDRLAGRLGPETIHRFLPRPHYWPERAYRLAGSLEEEAGSEWRSDLPRPLYLLPKPEPIEVTVPIPDYPPMLFQYQGQLHQVKKADGPERIEQEWWLQEGAFRDYYCVEDEEGQRYWLFRLGPYDSGDPQWFVHGFFA
jgi:protein ImuB